MEILLKFEEHSKVIQRSKTSINDITVSEILEEFEKSFNLSGIKNDENSSKSQKKTQILQIWNSKFSEYIDLTDLENPILPLKENSKFRLVIANCKKNLNKYSKKG